MYKPNRANTASGYGYGASHAQSAPNYGVPGHYPGTSPQNRAATAPTQTPPNNSAPPQRTAPTNGSSAQPGMQPQKGPAQPPAQRQIQQPHQYAPAQMGSTHGYHSGAIPYCPGTAAPQLQPPQAPAPIQYPYPQAAPTPTPNYNQQPDPETDIKPGEYISSKITQINAKDKVVDFSSKLIKAKVKDFANIHGRGGKDRAANSTIAVTICDFTKGTGEGKSVTASYNMDVAVVDRLYNAALKADLDELGPSYTDLAASAAIALRDLQRWELAGQQQPVSIVPFRELTDTGTALGNAVKANNPSAISAASNHALTDLRRWASNRKQCPSAGVPLREIFELKNTLAAALSTEGKPLYEYVSEKNVPYPEYRDAEGRYPCSKLCITYTPIRRGGEKSRYPWFIQIENFRAPLITKSNGASSHDASKAVDRRAVCINASTSDFLDCMVEVKRYIRIWEIVEAIPIVRKGLRWLEKVRAEKRNKKEK